MKSDPYFILGVNRNASAEDIKKAYRKLAHQYHPDKKGGNETKFKEINEAYQILSDPERKRRFDNFGSTENSQGYTHSSDFQNFGFGGGFESIFDMFSGFSTEAGSFGSSIPSKGEDINLEIRTQATDLGKNKIYEFELLGNCQTCKATGAKNGKLVTCHACNGQGRVRQAIRTPLGSFTQVAICQNCSGGGKAAEETCPDCSGSGRLKIKRKIEIKIPKNLGKRYLVVFPQEGNSGLNGRPAGDLLITII